MIARDHLITSLRSTGFLREILSAFALLTPKEKRQAALLILSMNVNAALGLVGLAGILPFIHLLMDAAPLVGDGLFARTMRSLGLTDTGQAIYAAGGFLIALAVLKNAFQLIHFSFQNRFCARAESRLATDLLTRVVRAPYAWLVNRNSSILRDVVVGQSIEWSRGIIRAGLQLINESLFLLAALALLIVASPLAGLVICGSAILLAVALVMISHPRIASLTERKRRAIRLAGVTASEAIAGGRDVRLSAAGPVFIASFSKDIQDYSMADAAGRQWQLMPRLGIEIIGFVVLVGVALGALSSGMPRAEVAALLTFYAVVAVRAIPIISQVVISVSALSGALPVATEIRSLLSELPATEDDTLPLAPGEIPAWRRLRLDDVRFNYTGIERSALGPLSLIFECGRSYGIVGKSGAGKSTLVDLVAGLLPPTGGHTFLDGKPLEGPLATAWVSGIAFVAQTPFLLDATLADNVEFGHQRSANYRQRLEHAIEAAGLADTVRGLPEGILTRLGERGVRLSGGQRQRVAIARALYRDARVLILDEATSALDSLTEREITDAIEALKGQITLIVVAHRISTVVRLDEVIVLDCGRAVASGTHGKLLQASSLYRRLVEAQAVSDTQTAPSVQAN
jgi:ABC-type multidrug transport system fused ATPase/permease subunit